MLQPIFNLIDVVLGLYVLVIVIRVVFNLLLVFGIVDYRNQAVRSVDDLCRALTDPLLRPIGRFIPPLNGFDFAPLLLLLLIEYLIRPYVRLFGATLG